MNNKGGLGLGIVAFLLVIAVAVGAGYYLLNSDNSPLSETEISTSEDLQNIQSNGMYVLANDIDISNLAWDGIDSFSGTLDGNGYSIIGLNFEDMRTGLCRGFVDELSGTIKNVNFENVNINAVKAGVVAGNCKGLIEDVTVSGYIGNIMGTRMGGFVSELTGTVRGCTNNCEVYGNSYIGGIAGYAYNGTVENSVHDGTVRADSAYAGGITGYDGRVIDCINKGIVQGGGNYVGGISSTGAIITGSINEGNVVSNGDAVGGIMGCNRSHDEITSCINRGDVTGNQMVGGIIGYNDEGNYNTLVVESGTITGVTYVGGFIGYSEGGIQSAIIPEGCTVIGNNSVGGIIGYGMSVTNCTSHATILSKDNYSDNINVGGIIGYMYYGNAKDCTFSGTIDVTGDKVGGIIETAHHHDWTDGRLISGCRNTGTVTSNGDNVGGIVGYADGFNGTHSYEISNCYNESTITGNDYVGGISGSYSYSVVIRDNNRNIGLVNYEGNNFGNIAPGID